MLPRLFLSVALASTITLPAQAATRIMILPFESPKEPSIVEALGPGTADSMITALMRLPDFIVIDRGTMSHIIREQKFQQSSLSDPSTAVKMGKLLGAEVLITGRVQAVGDQVRISASLVSVETGETKKAEQVTGALTKVFDLQDELVHRFLHAQGVKASAEEAKRLTEAIKSTNQLTAYELYQQGRAHYLTFTPEGYKQAIEKYKKAVEIDNKYALAYAGLAEVYAVLGFSLRQDLQPYIEELKYAKKFANIATSLNANLPEAKRALSSISYNLGEVDEAKLFAKSAIELSPNDAESWYALWATTNQHPDAIEINKALELNPFLISGLVGKAVALSQHSRFHDSLQYYSRAIQLSPHDDELYYGKAKNYFDLGDRNSAVENLNLAIKFNPSNYQPYLLLGSIYKESNEHQLAILAFEQCAKLSKNPMVTMLAESQVKAIKALINK